VLRVAFLCGFGTMAVIAALIPLGPGGALVPPDLLFCLVLAWTLRAPDPVPVLVLAGLGLFADALLSRPMGLGALGLLLAAEAMRALGPRLRGVPFPLEWLVAAVLFALVLAGMHVALRLVFAEGPPVVDLLRYLVATALAYPLMAAAVAIGLRRRPAVGERAA
jgi:rod shape-determining protein MreD